MFNEFDAGISSTLRIIEIKIIYAISLTFMNGNILWNKMKTFVINSNEFIITVISPKLVIPLQRFLKIHI